MVAVFTLFQGLADKKDRNELSTTAPRKVYADSFRIGWHGARGTSKTDYISLVSQSTQRVDRNEMDYSHRS